MAEYTESDGELPTPTINYTAEAAIAGCSRCAGMCKRASDICTLSDNSPHVVVGRQGELGEPPCV